MNDHAPAPAAAEGVHVHGDGYTAEAGWFGPEDRPRFGWLYRPDTPAPNGTGIVIVPPFGYEAICAHRTLRHLAEDAAEAGSFVVRFDLDGSGDSAGDDSDPDRVGAWLASIHDACDLARTVGATQLVLVGVRLGAMLAMLAAPQRKDVIALVAINAVIRGRNFVREGRALQAAMDLHPSPEPVADDNGQELIGFEISAETLVQIDAIDLSQSTEAPAPSVLLIERDDMPARPKLAAHLRTLGTQPMELRLPGYVDMMRDPMSNSVAQAIIGASIDFVRNIPPAQCPPEYANRSIVLRASATIPIGNTRVIETATMADGMFAIASNHAPDVSSHGTVLLLTVGALLHIGPNRMYVPLARELAAAGYDVLRVDLSGIGESRPRTSMEENIVYGPHAIEDVARWIDAAWNQGGAKTICVGVCSGSYHSLHAAIRGARVDDLLLVNPAVLRYAENIPAIAPDTPRIHRVRHYNQSARNKSAWKKLLRGNVSFKAIFDVAIWHAGMFVKHYGKEAGRRLRLYARDDLGGQLLSMAQCGTRVHFVFSRDEYGRTLLAMEAGSVVPRLCKAGKFSMTLFDGPDHTFTQRWAQARLHATLMHILTAPNHAAERR